MQKNNRFIPWILGFGLLMETLDSTVLNTALPQMALYFDASALTLKLAIVSYLITLAAFIPISAYATDRWGTQRVFFVAVALFITSSFLCGISQNLPELIIGRLLQGVGGAMITPVSRLILLKMFPRTEFIKVFTSLVLVGQLGVALGPTLGGTLTTFLNWRWVFFINLPIGIILLIGIVRLIPNYIESEKYRFDGIGFLLFSGAVGLITFALAFMTEQAFQHNTVSEILLATGFLSFILYLLRAKIISRPLLTGAIFRLRTFRLSILGSTIIRLPLNAPFFLLSLLFQVALGFSAFEAGLFLLPYGLNMVMSKAFFRKILCRYGFRRCLIMNPILLAFSLASFAFITSETPAWIILMLVGILGTLSSFQFSAMNTLNFADIDPKDSANASMIIGVAQQVTISFSVCLAAGLLISASNFHHVSSLNISAFHTTFWILGILSLLSILVFWRLKSEDGAAMLS